MAHQIKGDTSYAARKNDMEECDRSLQEFPLPIGNTTPIKPLSRPKAIECQTQDKGGNFPCPFNHRGQCYYLSRLDVKPYDIYSHSTRRHTVHLWNDSMSRQVCHPHYSRSYGLHDTLK